jgi:hypothetical protein
MYQSKTLGDSYQSRTVKNILQLLCWAAAWLGSCALMALGPRLLWNKALVLTLLAVCFNFCVGVGLILAHKKYLARLDELQQRIYLNALAITVGVALIVSIPYSVIDRYHLISFHANLSDLWILMSLTFLVSFFYGTWRYR